MHERKSKQEKDQGEVNNRKQGKCKRENKMERKRRENYGEEWMESGEKQKEEGKIKEK